MDPYLSRPHRPDGDAPRRDPGPHGSNAPRMRDLVGPLRRAVDLYLAGDLAAAEARLRNVLVQAPRLAEAHHHLAVVLHGRGQNGDAVRHLRTALDLDPHLVGAEARLALYIAERDAGDASAG